MGRWEALVKIVQTFVVSGRPGYGLLALAAVVLTGPFVAVLLVAAGAAIPFNWLGSPLAFLGELVGR